MSDKYYLGTVLERNGNFEYTDRILVVVPDEVDEEEFYNQIARDWRSSSLDDYENCDDGYWTSEQSMVFPFCPNQELTREEFELARCWLAVFNYEENQHE